jgi:hypothetical protein
MIDSNKNFVGREQASQTDDSSRNQVSSEAGRGMETVDPLAAFLSDPESHLSDILYL